MGNTPELSRAAINKWRHNCAVVIPCFNEAPHIGDIVVEVRRLLPTVIVVDDGSTDGTARSAADSGADVVMHSRNRGKGAALRTGWDRARARGFTWSLTMDGDGQHLPCDIPALLETAEKTQAAMVVGNRMGNCATMPWVRRKVNAWMTRRLSNRLGTSLADSQCGFRLIDLAKLSRVQLVTNHFEIESEMLTAFVHAGYRIEFVPVRTHYNSRKSRIRTFVDTIRWMHWWMQTDRRAACASVKWTASAPAAGSSCRNTATLLH